MGGSYGKYSIGERNFGDLRKKINEKAFSTWFKNTEIKKRTETEVIFYAANPFAADWVRKNYSDLIQKTASDILNTEVNITFTSRQDEEEE